jgi:ferredoxin
MEHRLEFAVEGYAPLQVQEEDSLSRQLNIENSPVLFGCRTGICGTCLIEVLEVRNGELPAPSSDELETLEIYAPGNPRARLACQIEVKADMKIRPMQWRA